MTALYTDADGDAEGTSTYQWYRADDNSGTNAAAIAGATAITTAYTTQAADAGKFLQFEVIPVAGSGTSPGSTVASTWSGPITTCLVTTEADNVAGSLRQILGNNPCCTAITFASGVNTITLGGTQLDIPGICTNLTVDGGSGVTISGNDASRVMSISNGATVTLDALTISNGKVSGSTYGGGIYSWGNLTVGSTTLISDNSAVFDGGSHPNGGGIYNHGMLTVDGTVSNNATSGHYGGIGIVGGGTVIVNGTVSNNTAGNSGGGIGIGGDGSGGGGTLIVNGVISGNVCGAAGGGIYVSSYSGGNTLIVNGTVSNNASTLIGGGIFSQSGVTLTLNSSNLIQGNHSDKDNIAASGSDIGGGIWTADTCPTTANYGSNNFRGSGTTTIDNCNGNP